MSRRHALPVDTEKPPIPLGQASVMRMLVGTLRVIMLKLMPVCALSRSDTHSRKIFRSLLLK